MKTLALEFKAPEDAEIGELPAAQLQALHTRMDVSSLRNNLIQAVRANAAAVEAFEDEERRLFAKIRASNIKKFGETAFSIPVDEIREITERTPLSELKQDPEKWAIYGRCAELRQTWFDADVSLERIIMQINETYLKQAFEEIQLREFEPLTTALQ